MNLKLLLIALLILFACNAKKGWTEDDKLAYINSCIEDNSKAIGEEKVKEYCECMQEKVQNKYQDYGDADRISMSQTLLISDSCAPRGWSNAEKDAFMKSCSDTRQTMGDNKQEADSYCNCMMEKIQSKYPDVTKTGNIPNEEMRAMANDCIRLRDSNQPD